MRILVAEDNRFYREMLEAAIRGWGYEPVVAGRGDEAWELLRPKDAPRLAVLDWLLPGISGLELCRKVRALRRPGAPYLIMLTAKSGKEDLVAALEAGADDYITKPFEMTELRARLQVGLRVAGLQADLADRNAALEVALSDAQKMEAMGRLAGGVAHDFNNLLTVINGYSHLLRGADDPRGREFAGIILQAAERGAALTRQLLAFARKQVLEPAVLDLNVRAAGVARMLGRVIGEQVRVVTALGAGLYPVEADAGQVDQVLINLLLNARDAMPAGGVVTITTANAELDAAAAERAGVAPGPYATLAVSDTGSGMDELTRARVFEPFFTTKGPGKGTGLGLASAHGIVRQSGGFIEVESEVGRGSTFRVSLPRAAAEQPGAGPEPPPAEVVVDQGTILVAEDDDRVRVLVDSLLTLRGYTTLQAADGAEALRVACGWPGPIHLLLTDVVMPGLTGPQLAERLAAARPGLKVMYMSGHMDDPTVREAGSRGGACFLAKPFTPDGLAEKVRRALGTAGAL
jgi:signal transduction histidine kinase